ncbi:MAG: efflux RND transporter periplasmic adaptor subunit [Gammaproteobacteria bacterium]|nr:efflux RND transporter periplasmic adaptor subunit [Gammaproteobacteria bacterium]
MFCSFRNFVGLVCLLLSSITMAQDVVGVLYSEMNLKLAMGDSGTIKKIHVRSGIEVKKGQKLVTLDQSIQRLEQKRYLLLFQDTEEQQSLIARNEIFESKYKAAQVLYQESRSISLDELDGLQLDLIQSRGRLAQLKEKKLREKIEYRLSTRRLAERQLVAPIDGIITKVAQQAGEWAKVGEPLIGLVDIKELFIKLNINDALARGLTVNTSVPIYVANLPNQTGIIDYISPVADPASGLVEIKIRVNNKLGLMRPGIKVTVPI